MVSQVQAVGIVLLAFGIPGAIWPGRVARLGEQFDAIGSERSLSEVEPADWKVGFTRVAGGVMGVVGAFWAVFG